MRIHAKKLVEGMDTSTDRIAVMTFSAPPRGKRNPSSKGRSNLKLLNSSGSVAKKQLMEDITNFDCGLQVDPRTRDVSAAVAAAIKILHQMPLDTNKYGSRRAGHLFLITSKMEDGELTGDFGGIVVHVLGVGAAFSPKNSMGGNGWCASLAPTPSLEMLEEIPIKTGSDRSESNSEKFPDKGFVEVNQILKIIRTNIDVGKLQDVKVFIQPGDGCEIKAVLGNTSLGTMFPGERRTVLVKVRVLNIKDWTGTETINGNETIDFDELERQLEATLGELKTTILTVQAAYFHPLLGTSGETFTERNEVQINRNQRQIPGKL
ncbi:hypothetical protein EDC01DRAFT_727301 [Geopyxis carbonaria]|nr:hypothetical protein EDC01DRAFT_727301 [Geopyxis carbonaria]